MNHPSYRHAPLARLEGYIEFLYLNCIPSSHYPKMAEPTRHCTFSTSPISTDAHSPTHDYPSSSPRRQHLSISTQLSPTSTRTYPDVLTFAKCAIQSSTASTDTEVSSDYGPDHVTKHGQRSQMTSPSPSLLTSMMQHNQFHCGPSAPTSRSSSTSQPGPITPSSSTCGKPILRRDTSAPTSASEDNGLGMKGLGLALTACGGIIEQPRRACSLKFAVRSPPSASQPLSDSGYSRTSSSSKKSRSRPTRGFFPEVDEEETTSSIGHSAHHHHHHHLAATLEQDEDEDEDEGYQEDSESGFTSDEEDDYFAPSRGRGTRSFQKWQENVAFAPYSPEPGPRRRVTPSADQAVVYTSTNEDCPPPPVTRGPGRKVSIADVRMKFDHCSRHLSPPPSNAQLSPEQITNIAPAPPAASSPSARGLCRRRESSTPAHAGPSRRMTDDHASPSTTFRPRPARSAHSDDSAFQTSSSQCQSILLKRDNSVGGRPVSPVTTFRDRGASVPAQCRIETRCANGTVSPVSSEAERESASQGLQRCLAKC